MSFMTAAVVTPSPRPGKEHPVPTEYEAGRGPRLEESCESRELFSQQIKYCIIK